MNNLTLTLAIWGAITGTIGTIAGLFNLILRYKQHQKDMPKLVCSSVFNFEHSSGEAKPKHKIIMRSVGKRPVTVDFIRYFIRPKPFWPRVFKSLMWKKERWIYDDSNRYSTHIQEGKKEEAKIKLPDGLIESDISMVKVYDQAGVAWPVQWARKVKIQKYIQYEKLYDSEKKNSKRLCKISGYSASGVYYIYVHWNPQAGSMNSFKGRYFSFKEEKEYLNKISNILDVQQSKLLALEIDEVE